MRLRSALKHTFFEYGRQGICYSFTGSLKRIRLQEGLRGKIVCSLFLCCYTILKHSEIYIH